MAEKEYIERETLYNDFMLLAKTQVGERQQGIFVCAQTVRMRKADKVAPIRFAEWIPDDYGFYHCSECGYEHDEPEYVTPFCPNCGAQMEQPEEMEEEMQPNTEYKHDTDKTRLDLVEPSLIEAVGRIRTYGVQKYHSPDNWRKVEKHRYVSAAMRHFEAYRGGEKNDPESGMPHLWHVACNIMFLIELERCGNADIK